MSVLRVVWAGNAETVQLSRAHIRQKYVPDMVGAFANGNANVFLCSIDAVEQAKLNACGVFGKDCEVNAVAHPGCAEGIGITKASPYRSHKKRRELIRHRTCIGNHQVADRDQVLIVIAFPGSSLTSPMWFSK